MTIKCGDLMQIFMPLGKDPLTYVCLNPECEEISYDFEMTRVTEPHGQVTLACPVCGSGEVE